MKKYGIALFKATMGIIALVVMKLLVSSMDTTEWNPSLQVFANDLLPVVLTACIILGTVSTLAYGGVVYIRYKKWEAFGNRLKVAYSAKFGYRNPAFDQEVDHHIKAVRALGNGYTKSRSINRLRALAKFTEVPFVIPEEERLPEEEKTEQYENI